MFKNFRMPKRLLASLFCLVLVLSVVTSVAINNQFSLIPQPVEAANEIKVTGRAPKYIFMFIGDGMSAVQVNSAQIYGGNNEHNKMELDVMNFQDFEAVGYQTTHDATSFAPDSASTATALSSGFKTWSGTIGLKPVGNQTGNKSENVNEDKVPKTIAERLKEEKGYNVVNTKEEILALNNKSGKTYAVTPVVQDGGAMPYAVDNKEGDLELADFVEKGIDVLDNKKGFFMMVESGKIDWAGHANDAKANIGDVLAFEESIQVAIDFAKKHPKDTLIVVTGDHETGGMTIGQATTNYDTAFEILENQKMTYVAFDALIDEMIDKNPNLTFEEVMPAITENFGLKNEFVDSDPNEKNDPYMSLELSDKEVARLEVAFAETMGEEIADEEDAFLLYGGYNPLSVTLTHILDNKAGIGWTSYAHTGVPVPVYATGAQAELFNGAYDNTEVYNKLVAATKLNN